MKITVLFLLSFLFVWPLSLKAQKGPAYKLTSNFAPESGKNGYIGSIGFNYAIRKCYGEVHVTILADKTVTPTHYIYKGQKYTAQDLGVGSFANAKVTAVTYLDADVFNGSQLIGKMRMKNVIDNGGFGCFGQSYRIKSQISNFNEEAFRDNLTNFRLRNPVVVASSYETKFHDILYQRERQALEEEQAKAKALAEEKKAQEEAKKKAAQAAGTAGASGAAATAQGPPPSSTPATNNQITNSSTKPTTSSTQSPSKPTANQQAQKAFNQAQRNVRAAERQADASAKKAAQGVGLLGQAAGGMWDDGMGLGLGLGSQEEDNSSYLQILFGSWQFPKSGKSEGKFWTGAYSYASFDLGTSVEPTAGSSLDPGQDKITTMALGVNFLNDSLGWNILRPVWGASWNFVDEYDSNGNLINDDSVKTEFGFDIGLALVGPGFILSVTRNSASEAFMYNFVWQK